MTSSNDAYQRQLGNEIRNQNNQPLYVQTSLPRNLAAIGKENSPGTGLHTGLYSVNEDTASETNVEVSNSVHRHYQAPNLSSILYEYTNTEKDRI
jgi:hypothetical protein